ncbi:MAG: hypothetical protein P4L51_12370 [Puia sp.]|nr:hypothetical protein [Puia sp.]
MIHNIAHTLSPIRPADLFREDKNQFYRNKLRRADRQGQEFIRYLAPPPPDEQTIRRLNSLACQAPFCIYNKYRKNNLL